MKIVFLRGSRMTCEGVSAEGFFAQTPIGILASGDDADSVVHVEGDLGEISEVCALEAPGLDEEGLTALVGRALRRGYLENPAILGNGEALLFVIVNEAVHEMGSLDDID
jgi:hypothetical protein